MYKFMNTATKKNFFSIRLIIFYLFAILIGCTGKTGNVRSSMNQDQSINKNHHGHKDQPITGLILTGLHHPDHPWQETTPVIKESLEIDERIRAEVSTDIEDLSRLGLKKYDFLVLNYCNWEKPEGLSTGSKEAFVRYLKNGGGLLIIHFADGAWHSSLPGAEASDWPEFRKICRRVWDHKGTSAHDVYDTFYVHKTTIPHYITESTDSFETVDELYYNQAGEDPIVPLLTARSKNTGKDEPLAWVYNYGKGRIFQTLLGHNGASFKAPQQKEILRRAAIWVSGKDY
jgi:type 1 glutamine amidotransferase